MQLIQSELEVAERTDAGRSPSTHCAPVNMNHKYRLAFIRTPREENITHGHLPISAGTPTRGHTAQDNPCSGLFEHVPLWGTGCHSH
jgi:hypothetical protein